jgi:hypothetical protein
MISFLKGRIWLSSYSGKRLTDYILWLKRYNQKGPGFMENLRIWVPPGVREKWSDPNQFISSYVSDPALYKNSYFVFFHLA